MHVMGDGWLLWVMLGAFWFMCGCLWPSVCVCELLSVCAYPTQQQVRQQQQEQSKYPWLKIPAPVGSPHTWWIMFGGSKRVG